jgi:hypothetical protein
MDPITLILSALAAGAAAALQETVGQAVKDAYAGLKALIVRKFADKPPAKTALDEYEKEPEVWKKPLEQALNETGANQDEKIIQAAQKLMELVDPRQAAAGKYIVQISGNVQGLVQGDNAKVEMHFEDPPKDK